MIPLSLAHFTNYKEVTDDDENENHDDDNYDEHLQGSNILTIFFYFEHFMMRPL